MSKKLIVCCDGTWNHPDQKDDGVNAPTNVRKIYSGLPKTKFQKTHYQRGVGTGGVIDKAVGGIFGAGISKDIRDCYHWLANNYEVGDEIYLFGFSRGAFAARSLAGMIAKIGLLKLDKNFKSIEYSQSDAVEVAYHSGYRNGEPKEEWQEDLIFHEMDGDSKIAIKFIGVWDTVGALGVPDDKVLLDLFDSPKKFRFHDLKLSPNVEKAFHAVAIDEKRGSFTPTLWEDDARVTQMWFPGVHSDVGGGYKETGLSDGALMWMVGHAKQSGLEFANGFEDQIQPNPMDLLHDSHKGVMKVLITAPRTIPNLASADREAYFHSSVFTRKEKAPIGQPIYLPTENQDFENLEIESGEHWNWTGFYLEKGKRYKFEAHGEWQDKSIACGPGGTKDGRKNWFDWVHHAGTVGGFFERAWKKLTKKEQADFFGTRRVELSPWFCLTGAIADGGNPAEDGTHERLTYFKIGKGKTITAKSSGYLYCFANDAWGFYGNNSGSVYLNIAESPRD